MQKEGRNNLKRLVEGYASLRSTALSAVALFFAVFALLGGSFKATGSWTGIWGSGLQAVVALGKLFFFYVLYKMLLAALKYVVRNKENFRTEADGRLEKILFGPRDYVATFFVCMICYLPVMLSFFPGTLEADAYRQLLNFRTNAWDAHYPVAATLIMDGLLRLGQNLFGNDNLAFFLYTGLQCLIQWLVFSYTAHVIGKMKAPVWLRWGTLLYFSLFSLFQSYGYTMVKDSMFYIAFLLAMAAVADLSTKGGKKLLPGHILLVTACCLLVLFRNNGLHLILFSIIVAFLISKDQKHIYAAMLAGAALGLVLNGALTQIYQVEGGSVREALSVPLQQTARYLKEHPDEVSAEERQVLEQLFDVEPERIAELYQPEISDPVKDHVEYRPDKELLAAYLGVWWKQFLRHPGTYVQAFLNHIYGYFYPGRECFWEGIGVYDIGEKWPWDQVGLHPYFVMGNGSMRERIEQVHLLVSRIPVLGLLYRCGTHTFLLIAFAVVNVENRKRQNLFFYVPCIGCVLICIISPVNALIRYMLPVMACLPLNFAWNFKQNGYDGGEYRDWQKNGKALKPALDEIRLSVEDFEYEQAAEKAGAFIEHMGV